MQELATSLMRVRFEDPDRWAALQPYWASLPDKDQLYSKYSFEKHHLPLLQDASLVRTCREQSTHR